MRLSGLALLLLLASAPLGVHAEAPPVAAVDSGLALVDAGTAPAPDSGATLSVAAAQLPLGADGLPLSEPPVVESAAGMLIRTLGVLGLTVALIYVTLHLGARKLLGLAGGKPGLVRVVERIPLEPRKTLYLVEVAGQFLLVGASDQGLTSIGPLDSERLRAAQSAATGAAAPSSFASRLDARAAPSAPPAAESPTPESSP